MVGLVPSYKEDERQALSSSRCHVRKRWEGIPLQVRKRVPREETVGRHPSASQEEGSHQELNLPAP